MSGKMTGEKDMDILSDMLSSVVELLVEKGVITQEEYEDKVRDRLMKAATLKPHDLDD